MCIMVTYSDLLASDYDFVQLEDIKRVFISHTSPSNKAHVLLCLESVAQLFSVTKSANV